MRDSRKRSFFDIKLDFSTKDTRFWYEVVELNEFYLRTLVSSEYDEFS